MAEIIFRCKDDAEKFYHYLLKNLKIASSNKAILLKEERNIVKIVETHLSDSSMNHVKEVFYEFIIKVKRDDWFKKILEETYYFHDKDEQSNILEIIYSILEGEREDLEYFLKKTNEEPRIKETVNLIFQDNISLSFDSFIKFRLRAYLAELESYVKVSIDEYKMEQEYQMFVQTLRKFLLDRPSKMETLHLLFNDEIIFFNESFEEIKRGELTKMIDRKLLSNHPVYVDSATIAPLLSIAPKQIFLYTKDSEEALIRTIKNIFEERVSVMPFHSFHHAGNAH